MLRRISHVAAIVSLGCRPNAAPPSQAGASVDPTASAKVATPNEVPPIASLPTTGEAFVVLRSGASLQTSAGHRLALPQSAGRGWVFRVLRILDDGRLEVATKVDAWSHCETPVPWSGNESTMYGRLDILFAAERGDLLPVLPHGVERTYPDGSAVRLAAGSIVLEARGEGRRTVDAAGVQVDVSLAPSEVSRVYQVTESFWEIDGADGLDLEVPVVVGGKPVRGFDRLDRMGHPAEGPESSDEIEYDQYVIKEIVLRNGARSRVMLGGQCAYVTVDVPSDAIEERELGGIMGGILGPPPATAPRMARLPEGTPLTWPDGSPAGTVVDGPLDVPQAGTAQPPSARGSSSTSCSSIFWPPEPPSRRHQAAARLQR